MVELIAKRYGQALFELATESGDLVGREQEINQMLDGFTENEDFMTILNHPKLHKGDKIDVLLQVFEGKVSEDLIGFLVLAVQKGRQDNIVDILKYTLAKIEEHNGFVTAYVASAVTLTKEDEKLIINKLESQTGKKITLVTSVDKSLIGGLSIRINDRIVDNSIKSALSRMARDVYDAKV